MWGEIWNYSSENFAVVIIGPSIKEDSAFQNRWMFKKVSNAIWQTAFDSFHTTIRIGNFHCTSSSPSQKLEASVWSRALNAGFSLVRSFLTLLQAKTLHLRVCQSVNVIWVGHTTWAVSTPRARKTKSRGQKGLQLEARVTRLLAV